MPTFALYFPNRSTFAKRMSIALMRSPYTAPGSTRFTSCVANPVAIGRPVAARNCAAFMRYVAVRDVPVPTGLKDQLLKRLAEERAEAWRKRILQAVRVAIAAGLLLAVGVGIWVWGRQRPFYATDVHIAWNVARPMNAEESRRLLENYRAGRPIDPQECSLEAALVSKQSSSAPV